MTEPVTDLGIDPARVGEIASRILVEAGHPATADWTQLRSSDRTIVLRSPGWIAKLTHVGSGSGGREAKVLARAAELAPTVVPMFAGTDESSGVMVMQDLGSSGSLADDLLGSDAHAAEATLFAWVDSLATLHSSTLGQFTPGDLPATWLGDRVASSVEALQTATPLLPAVSDAMIADLESATRLLLQPERESAVLSFGDMCPDNNVRNLDQCRFIDAEGGSVAHPAVDLANLTLPFPTCWCSFDLPVTLRQRLVDHYRVQADAAVTATMSHGLAAAASVFATVGLALAAPTVTEDDTRYEVGSVALPSTRERIMQRTARAIHDDHTFEQWPDLAAWLNQAHLTLTDAWGDLTTPLAPAFR